MFKRCIYLLLTVIIVDCCSRNVKHRADNDDDDDDQEDRRWNRLGEHLSPRQRDQEETETGDNASRVRTGASPSWLNQLLPRLSIAVERSKWWRKRSWGLRRARVERGRCSDGVATHGIPLIAASPHLAQPPRFVLAARNPRALLLRALR